MTAPVSNLGIDITDNGTALLSAADWAAEGHLWSIAPREITIQQLRDVAKVLGPDAVAGVEARLQANRQRLRQRVDTTQARVRDAEKAAEDLARLDAALGQEL